MSVRFEDPPGRRGGAPALDPHERELAKACQERPGHWALYGRMRSYPDAEHIRRKIKRGQGPWRGGSAVWVVAVRKQGDDAWQVHVAYAPRLADAS